MQTKIIERYFFFSLLLATLVFTFFIFRPFLIVLILSISFAVVLYPVFKWFKNKKIPDWLASLITVFLFIIILCGPLFGLGIMVFKQSQNVYHLVISNGNTSEFVNLINASINKIMPSGIVFDITDKASTFISFLSNNIAKIFSTTLNTLFYFSLLFFSIFYFLKDGEKWKENLVKLSPLPKTDDKKIIKRLSSSINGIIKGHLLIALVQGLLVGIGFAIFKISNPALWGAVAGICSFIPSVGTAIVTLPAIIFLFATGNFVIAIGLSIWSIILVGMTDNLLTPLFVGKKMNISPFLILISVLGGISLLGPVGILIGPLSVSLLVTLVSIYKNEFN